MENRTNINVEDLIEVRLLEQDNFLKIKETLTRIGVASASKQTLYQSCHILHKRGKYYITHFKELFGLDGKLFNFSDEDKARRNTIVNLLSEWKLIEVVNPERIKEPTCPLSKIKVLAYKDKKEWTLTSKYSVGTSKKRVVEPAV